METNAQTSALAAPMTGMEELKEASSPHKLGSFESGMETNAMEDTTTGVETRDLEATSPGRGTTSLEVAPPPARASQAPRASAVAFRGVSGERDSTVHYSNAPRAPSRLESIRRSIHEAVEIHVLTEPPPSATFNSTVVTMSKNMLGAGLLSMADAFKYGSIGPSMVAFLIVMMLSMSTMFILAVLCHRHHANSYRQLWNNLVGQKSAPLVDVFIILNSLFACISYCSLIESWATPFLVFSPNSFANMMVIAVVVLFPLTLLRDLHALRKVSLAGVFCNVVGVVFVVWQACYHSDERIVSRACGTRLSGGCTSGDVFIGHLWNPSIELVRTVSICASTVMIQYNIPKMYSEYQDRDPVAFRGVLLYAIGIVGCIATTMGVAGLLRFGTSMKDGDILSHFERQFPGTPDAVMSGGERVMAITTRLLMLFNIVASFPLLFSPMRCSAMQLVGMPVEEMPSNLYIATTAVILLACVVLTPCFPNLSAILTLKGAVCGMGLSYIFPAILLWQETAPRRPMKVNVFISVVFLFGIFFCFQGTYRGLTKFVQHK